VITEGLFSVFSGFVRFMIGLLPSGSLPEWVDDGAVHLREVWALGAGLGAWVPWSLFGTVAAAVMGCVVIGFGIKVARIVASFFTAGGGSAA
jgi:hypothetical protein